MDSYVISRFLHILGALGLFMAIGFEWLGLPERLRRFEITLLRS
jgi:hypothetical protein